MIKCEAIISGDRVYYSGQTITGKICLSLDERILIKGLALTISGYAQSEWNAAKKESDKPFRVSGREDFIATTTYLIGSEDSKSILLPIGSYTYSFSCNIPDKCQSSFESVSGHIRYQLKVVLEYGERTEDILTELLHIIKPFDLNSLDLSLQLPLDEEVFESKCFCELWKTPLQLYVNLPQAGFVPGEVISVYTKLFNEGNVPLWHIAISLNQVVTYSSLVPRELTMTVRYNIVQVLNGLAGKQPLREFLERITIPSVPPTSDNDSKIIQISYEVEVFVDQIKGKRNILARVPILIGTKSFQSDLTDLKENGFEDSTVEERSATPAAIITSSHTSLPSETHITSLDSIHLPPGSATSFQEASFMPSANLSKNKNNSLGKDGSGFKPRYLFYEINEDIEMTPTSMDITKEITISST